MRGEDFNGDHMYYLCNQMEKKSVPSYFYMFSRLPVSKNQTAGSYHSCDVPFVFGTHDMFFRASKEDIVLRNKLQNYWVSFMKTGNPNVSGLPNWTAWSKENARWMNFNHDLREEPVSREAKLKLLEKTLVRKIEEFDDKKIIVKKNEELDHTESL